MTKLAGLSKIGETEDISDVSIGRDVIDAEIRSLHMLRDSLDDHFVQAVKSILGHSGRVICSGIGKSGHVARKIAATLASTGTPSHFVHASEASHGDLGMITQDDVVLALSRSGETSELSDLIHFCRRYGVTLIAMTACSKSTLGQLADIPLLVPDVDEACLATRAPTTSTTLMMALGDALAVALLTRRKFGASDFKIFHPGGKLGASLKTADELMHKASELPLARMSQPLEAAIQEISDKQLGCVGIIDDDSQLVGIITDGDVRRLALDPSAERTVMRAMSRDPLTITHDVLAADILRMMNTRKITQIFVVRDGRPEGIVHLHDLLIAGVA